LFGNPLDGYYSAGETAQSHKDNPIFEELQHIFDTPDRGHVIIIESAVLIKQLSYSGRLSRYI
jgi:hypothetical protein